jgi:hypothetical protein
VLFVIFLPRALQGAEKRRFFTGWGVEMWYNIVTGRGKTINRKGEGREEER